jgi:hypothetical protein
MSVAAAPGVDARRPGGRLHVRSKARAHRERHRDMAHEPFAEEALLPGEGPVDELVHDHERSGWKLLAQRADRADRNDVGHAEALERVDVGAVVDPGGRDAMTAAMTGQEGDAAAPELADQELVRRLAERRLRLDPARVLQPFDRVNAASADYRQHLCSPELCRRQRF